MSYQDRIDACNHYDLNHFRAFRVNDTQVGWIKHELAERLSGWPAVFKVSSAAVNLAEELCSFEARTDAVDGVLNELLDQGVIHRRHGEWYPVSGSDRERALFIVDRAAAPYFGLRAFGQHLNGYIRNGKHVEMWLGRRALTKWNAPGKLDNMVAGGLPQGISLQDNLAKECWEEAAIPPELASQAVPTGVVTYCAETEQGLKPDIIYCYDLELPSDFKPQCMDGEVDDIVLWPVERVAEVVRESEEFKLNCNLVIIDFLIRHGFIDPSETGYLELAAGLRQRMAD
jgi:isopentenyldiphosphate isomerase